MVNIDKGGNTVVPTQPVRIAVCHSPRSGAPAVDASALLLGARGKVRGDADLVFFNQPQHPSGTVRHLGVSEGGGQLAEWLEVDLARLEPAVERVVIAGSADGGPFGQVSGLYAQITAGGAVVATYQVRDASTETAFVLGELYRRGAEWKFRAVGQGYDSGLAGLATDFGIDVAQAPPAPVAQPAPPLPPARPAPLPAAAMPAGPPPAHAFLERTGRGDDVLTVEVPLPYGPVIVEATATRSEDFCVYTLDASNEEDELLFNSAAREFRGRALAFAPGDRPLRLRVHADEAWTVRVLPLGAALPLTGPLQGAGPEVLIHAGPMADLRVRHQGDGDDAFVVWSARPDLSDADDRELLVNELGPTDSTAPLTEGPLLLLLEADGTWSADLRTLAPYPQQPPAQAHTPAAVAAPGTQQGRGDATVTLVNPHPGHPAVLEYDIQFLPDSVAGHQVHLLDEYDDRTHLLYGSDDGRRGRILMFREGEPEQRLRIEQAADWRLRVLPADAVQAFTGPVSGSGRTLLRYDGPPAMIQVRRKSPHDRQLTVSSLHPDGRSDTASQTLGRRPVTGPLAVSGSGYTYVSVRADEASSWELESLPLDRVPVLTRKLSGKGYGIFRMAGLESDVFVTLVQATGLDIIALWTLDEHLRAERRLTLGSGLHRIPAGLIQVRTAGKWTLEVRR